MIENSEGDLLTPSVVLFNESEVVVGKEARTATTVSPDRVAEWVKRDMGAPVYHRPIRGEYFPPEVIQACILRKLRSDIARALGPTGQVVITVPAYFDEPRRKSTADAGEMAGLTVLDIVNEPVAAALAFGEIEGYLSPSTGKPLVEMTVMVYDLGGGTFDVTLLRLAPGDIRTLATDGDVQLGGHDWDRRVLEYVAEQFRLAHGPDPRDDPAAVNRLCNEVIEAKHTLSARRRAKIRLDYAGHSLEQEVSREQFEELTDDLLERTAYTSRQLVGAAGLDWPQVDRVLLVGGSTRMAMVSQMLQNLTGIVPDHTVNPDEAVARGAAIYANYLLAKDTDEIPDLGFEVTNVNSHSLGIEGIEPETMRKTNVILIPRNTPLPATFSEKFITKKASQRSIVIQVLEGESSLPGECTAIGRTVVRGLPPDLPQGWPVEVTFEYATNGLLSVRAVVPGTHRESLLEMEREVGLSNEGIAGWKQTVGSAAGLEAYGSMMEDPLNRAGPTPGSTPPSPLPVDDQTDDTRWDAGPLPVTSPAPSQEPTAPVPPASSQPSVGAPVGSTGETPQPAFDPGLQAVTPQVGDGAQPSRADLPAQTSLPQTPAPPGAHTDGLSASPTPAAPPAHDEPVDEARRQAQADRRIPGWLVNLIGFAISAIVGLAVGYVIVCWLFPEAGFPKFW
jgi:molecular chaperone DnaK